MALLSSFFQTRTLRFRESETGPGLHFHAAAETKEEDGGGVLPRALFFPQHPLSKTNKQTLKIKVVSLNSFVSLKYIRFTGSRAW